MANMRLCMLLFGLVIVGLSSGDNEVALTCHELNMAAVFDAVNLKGDILEISMTGCAAATVDLPAASISVAFKDCGKASQGDELITQENEVAVLSGQRDAGKGIQRLVRNYFALSCTFDRKLQLSSGTAVEVTDKREEFADSQKTEFSASMSIFSSDAFEVKASDPFAVIAFTPIHMQIKGTHNNQLFKFVTQSCFATPSGDVNDATKYLFFEDRCGMDSSFKTHSVATPNTYSFSVEAFTFIKIKKMVYFHCKLIVCTKDAADDECQQINPDCAGQKRRKRRSVARSGKLEEVMVKSTAIKWNFRRN